jgi:hypothetical protein
MLIFDKSALQALTVDESNWLDNFFLSNITPLFLTETLADLEKQVGAGRTPEEVVGDLALRTPDMQAYPCAHHRWLLGGDLYGHEVPMDGRIPCSAGKVVRLDNKRGVFFSRTKEEEALRRWYRAEFVDVERQIAKTWRRELCNLNHEEMYAFFQKWFLIVKPRDLAEVKTLTDAYIDGSPRHASLRFGMNLLDIPEERQREIFEALAKCRHSVNQTVCPVFPIRLRRGSLFQSCSRSGPDFPRPTGWESRQQSRYRVPVLPAVLHGLYVERQTS